MPDTLAAAARLADVPEGAVPYAGATVVGYVTEDGDMAIGAHSHNPDANLSELVGLLEMAKHWLIFDAEEDD